MEAVDKGIEEVCRRTLPAGQTWRRLMAESPERAPRPTAPTALPEIGLAEEAESPEAEVRPVRPFRHLAAEIFQIQPIYAAAAETPTGLQPVKTLLQWISPDGRRQARLSIPSAAAEEAILVLEFLTSQEELASELGGQPVWLSGVETHIEPDGVARVPLKRLREQLGQPEREIILQVGPDRTEWTAVEDT